MLVQQLALVLSIFLTAQDLFVRKVMLFPWRDSATVWHVYDVMGQFLILFFPLGRDQH